jgi:hypothetical protein
VRTINESAERFAQLMNAMALPEGAAAPEWISIPYADVPYDRDGTRGVQRLDRAAAETLIQVCASDEAADPRRKAGIPVYVGHPDYVLDSKEAQAAWLQRQPEAVGWVKELRSGANSLDLRVAWTERGTKLVGGRAYKFFSPFFLCEKTGTERGRTVFTPRYVVSAGLTNTPNWPMPPMVNSANASGGAKENHMTLLQRLAALFVGQTVQTEDDAVGAVTAAVNALAGLRATIDTRWKADDAARAALPNAGDTSALAAGYIAHIEAGAAAARADAAAQKARAATLNAALAAARKESAERAVNAAVARGAILQEHAASRVQDLVNAGDAGAAKAKEIDALPKLMKTESAAGDIAARGKASADKREQILGLVNAAMPQFGNDYDKAFAHITRTKPELFKEDK